MRILVKIGEPLWRTVGSRSLTLEWDGPVVTVAEALDRLYREYPDFGPAFRGEGQRMAVDYHVFVNTRMVRPDAWSETGMKDTDRLFIFLPAVGG
jgi:sulfur carrier protein ThiS